MTSKIKTLFALLALILMLPLQAGEKVEWTFSYKVGQIYSYQIVSQVNYQKHTRGYLMDPVTYEFTYYPGDINSRRLNLTTDLEFEVQKVLKNGDAHVKAWFTDVIVSAGVKVDTPNTKGQSVSYTQGKWKEASHDTENKKIRKFNAILPAKGGFVIKSKLSFMSKAMGQFLKLMNKQDKTFAKRHKEMSTTKWWQQLLSVYFIAVPDEPRFPCTTAMKIPLFLGANHGIDSPATDTKKGCPIRFDSLVKSSSDSCKYLEAFYEINKSDGPGDNMSQLANSTRENNSYIMAPEGHLKFAPFSTKFFHRITGAGTQITLQSVNTTQCKFTGMRPVPEKK